jgi:hypothetical protein
MQTSQSRPGDTLPDAASREPSRRWAARRQGIAAGALGLLIGVGLGVAGAPLVISGLPLMDGVSAGGTAMRAPAVDLAVGGATLPPASRDLAATAASAVVLPAPLAADPAGAWTALLPGGMEPCWADPRANVTC